MTLKLRHALFFGALGLLAAAALSSVFAEYRSDTTASQDRYVYYSFFATSTTDTTRSTTTSAVSTDIDSYVDSNGRIDDGSVDIRGAEKVTMYFGRTVNESGGNSTFSVEVTPDGTNWYDFDRLLIEDGSNTATTTYTIANATTTDEVSLDLTYHTYSKLRCVVVETTDGTHTCATSVEY